MTSVGKLFSRCVQCFATLWITTHRAPLLSIISQSLLKFMSIELVMLSNHLILYRPLLLLPSPFAFNLSQIRIFSNEWTLHIRWPKYWSFDFSISPSNEYSGLMHFRTDYFISLQSKEHSRVFSSTTIWKHQFFSAQLSLWSKCHICTQVMEKL